MFILDLTAMKVLLLLFPFVLAAFGERAQVFFLNIVRIYFPNYLANHVFSSKKPNFPCFFSKCAGEIPWGDHLPSERQVFVIRCELTIQ